MNIKGLSVRVLSASSRRFTWPLDAMWSTRSALSRAGTSYTSIRISSQMARPGFTFFLSVMYVRPRAGIPWVSRQDLNMYLKAGFASRNLNSSSVVPTNVLGLVTAVLVEPFSPSPLSTKRQGITILASYSGIPKNSRKNGWFAKGAISCICSSQPHTCIWRRLANSARYSAL